MNQSTPFTLRRVHQDGSQEPVSGHPDFGSGWSAGQSAVAEDRDNAYSLYEDGQRVAKFGHSRLQTRVSSFDWIA